MAKSGNKQLSIAILAFNEEQNIATTLDETIAFCKEALLDWEIIVVDDGSRDSTAAIADEYAQKEQRVKVVRHSTNLGMGAGIRTGIESAQKSHFVYNAADGQVAAREIGKTLALLDVADIALSVYENRRETVTRELLSFGLRLYMRLLDGIKFRHEGLLIFPTKEAKEIVPLIRANTFFFCFELVQRGLERGLTAATTQVVCSPRASGASKVTNPRRILRVAKDALDYGLRKRFSPD